MLANLFLHYAFDMWLAREFPSVQFERYADDAVVHCGSESQAREVLAGDRGTDGRGRAAAAPGQDPDRVLQGRTAAGLARAHVVHVPGLHVPARAAHGDRNGKMFTSFLPGGQQGCPEEDERRGASWRLHTRIGTDPGELARWINPIVRGWMQYYGRFYRSALYPLLQAHQHLPDAVGPQEVQTAAGPSRKSRRAWKRSRPQYPRYFAHWRWVHCDLVTRMIGAG